VEVASPDVENDMEKSNTTIHLATAFILGSLAGAGIALILAPQSGKRTREDLRYWGKIIRIKSEKAQREFERGMKTLVADVSEKLQNAVEEGKQLTDRTLPGLLGALDSGKKSIKAEIDKVMHRRAA
jgi:gas vesicle protein